MAVVRAIRNGQPVDVTLSANEIEQIVAEHRAQRFVEFQQETFGRIAALYGKTDPAELAFAELNDMSRAAVLMRKESKGIATAAEVAELDALEQKKALIDAIRQAGNDATSALQSAGTDTAMTVDQRIAEIDAVTPAWP